MKHDFNNVFETENELWNRVLEIFEKNEKFPKKRVKGRELHHKFPRSFSKKLGEPIDNDKDNLISLSLADHFLVHYYCYLLAKKGYRQAMATAFLLMARKCLKYITPETAEMMANDYAEAKQISNQARSEALKSKELPKEQVMKIALGHIGLKHSEETKNKLSESMKKYYENEENRKRNSEARIGIPHPHKGGFQSDEKRKKVSDAHKGKPGTVTTEFGKKFKEHFGIASFEDEKLYMRERYYYKKYGKCRWEQ